MLHQTTFAKSCNAPDPGDPYRDEQTLADTQARYPGADLTPYR